MNEADIKISRELRNLMGATEEVVNDIAGEKMGVCLFVFPRNRIGRFQYASNAQRKDMRHALQQLLDSWDQGMDDIEAHKVN